MKCIYFWIVIKLVVRHSIQIKIEFENEFFIPIMNLWFFVSRSKICNYHFELPFWMVTTTKQIKKKSRLLFLDHLVEIFYSLPFDCQRKKKVDPTNLLPILVLYDMDSFWAKCSRRKKKLWRAEREKKNVQWEEKKSSRFGNCAQAKWFCARSVQSIERKKKSVANIWHCDVVAPPMPSHCLFLWIFRPNEWIARLSRCDEREFHVKMGNLISGCCIDETRPDCPCWAHSTNFMSLALLLERPYTMHTFFFFVVDVLIYSATEFF